MTLKATLASQAARDAAAAAAAKAAGGADPTATADDDGDASAAGPAAAAAAAHDNDLGAGDTDADELARRAARERRRAEDRACLRLRALVSAAAVLCGAPTDSPAVASVPEPLLRTLTRLFQALAEAVASQAAPRGARQAPPGPKFRALVDTTYTKLANDALSAFIQDVENQREGAAGAGAQGAKARPERSVCVLLLRWWDGPLC